MSNKSKPRPRETASFFEVDHDACMLVKHSDPTEDGRVCNGVAYQAWLREPVLDVTQLKNKDVNIWWPEESQRADAPERKELKNKRKDWEAPSQWYSTNVFVHEVGGRVPMLALKKAANNTDGKVVQFMDKAGRRDFCRKKLGSDMVQSNTDLRTSKPSAKRKHSGTTDSDSKTAPKKKLTKQGLPPTSRRFEDIIVGSTGIKTVEVHSKTEALFTPDAPPSFENMSKAALIGYIEQLREENAQLKKRLQSSEALIDSLGGKQRSFMWNVS
ncbi:hypothetical protein FOCC_FOCC007341 [Frankliniella occidentalis]|uniref:Uncharacterized protein LOC113213075 isoform X2 n=1 Tax=Frankliniella occidentalis TaxID=133901 RepID=A0A6J1T807_FRAOC|nr:uncharacterized protein LOC113213075 isoform X2 [Frankliniella occidentalis]KAE8745979.1 hypothetical protein FOCC_FOCC007341 [Frankliniella occidentalis]